MQRPDKIELIEMHRTEWASTITWFGFLCFFGVLEGVILLTYLTGHYWVMIPLMVFTGHVMHAHVIAFHETAHRTLCPNRSINDAIGIFVGMLSFMSFTLYRVAHHSHHSYLSTERDEELWPFTDPARSRAFRFAAAIFELTMGLVYTPLLFLRSFFRAGSPVSGAARIQVWAEFALIIAFWSGTVALTWWTGKWDWLFVIYVVPAWISGNLQSIRKYIEHMGLLGSTPLGSTRSVVATGLVGKVISYSMFDVPYHGVHHKYARLPHSKLVELEEELEPQCEAETSPFTNYWTPCVEMVKGLSNPRIGAQWLSK